MDNSGICIITFPYSNSGVVPSSNLVNIIKDLYDETFVLAPPVFSQDYENKSNNVNIYIIDSLWEGSKFNRLKNFLDIQIKISWKLLKLRKQFNKCIFFIGGDLLLIPSLICKLLNKEILLYFAGSVIETSSQNEGTKKYTPFLKLFSYLIQKLATTIIIYSPRLIKEWKLEAYHDKIVISHEHFLDLSNFKINIPVTERNLIGYVGRFSEEKGVINFLESIPKILKESESSKFLIIGNGLLKEKIETYIHKEGLKDHVNVINWVNHNELPYYLNKLKLLVIPSYTEGLPNIMLESMACGTPVLATTVGAIPDVLKEQETGFIMEKNSPSCIAKNVIKVLRYKRIERISSNALKVIEERFTREKVVDHWKKIL